MHRELLLATVVSAVWLTLCFTCFGALYLWVGDIIGFSGLMRFEHSLGDVGLPGGVGTVGRAPILLFGVAMMAASLPVNMYWMNRLRNLGGGA